MPRDSLQTFTYSNIHVLLLPALEACLSTLFTTESMRYKLPPSRMGLGGDAREQLVPSTVRIRGIHGNQCRWYSQRLEVGDDSHEPFISRTIIMSTFHRNQSR